MTPADRQSRLAEVSSVALKVAADTGVPAKLIVSQWAIESRWGSKPVGKANYFGIKCASRHKECCTVTTREWFTELEIFAWDEHHPDWPARRTGETEGNKSEVMLDDRFADYDSLEESVRDFAWLISHGQPYAAAWEQYQKDHDDDDLIAGIAKHYSTSPEYTQLVQNISRQQNVVDSISNAKADV